MMITELEFAIAYLRTFSVRAQCNTPPSVMLTFKSQNDQARFLAEFRANTKPTDFHMVERFHQGVLSIRGVEITTKVEGQTS